MRTPCWRRRNSGRLSVAPDADARFLSWLQTRYSTLHSLPFAQAPAMLHHVPHYLAYRLGQTRGRTALLVLDGLSLQQWEVLGPSLPPELEVTETATFAWLPTLTSVSRQALISGLAPVFLPDSLRTTDREKGHWQRFLDGPRTNPEPDRLRQADAPRRDRRRPFGAIPQDARGVHRAQRRGRDHARHDVGTGGDVALAVALGRRGKAAGVAGSAGGRRVRCRHHLGPW